MPKIIEVNQNKRTRYTLVDKNKITWEFSISDTGAYIRTNEGLTSKSYHLCMESDTFCGARKHGTGKRNWNRFLKVLREWNKKSVENFWDLMWKYEVEKWTR